MWLITMSVRCIWTDWNFKMWTPLVTLLRVMYIWMLNSMVLYWSPKMNSINAYNKCSQSNHFVHLKSFEVASEYTLNVGPVISAIIEVPGSTVPGQPKAISKTWYACSKTWYALIETFGWKELFTGGQG